MHKKLKDSRFCSIDIETTGLNIASDEIIAFACIPIDNSKILVRDLYYTLIKPNEYVFSSMKYHGISKDNLTNAPVFIDIADRIMNVLDGVIVGYAVDFDYSFLKRYFKGLGVKLKRDVLDIAMIEKGLRYQLGEVCQDLSFEAIMRAYGLRPCYRHNACADAFLAAQIFQFQMRKLSALGLDSTDRVIKFVKHHRYADPGLAF